MCSHRSGHRGIGQHKAGFVPDTEDKQEPPAQHRRSWGSHVAITACHPPPSQMTGSRAPRRPGSAILITGLQPAMTHPRTTWGVGPWYLGKAVWLLPPPPVSDPPVAAAVVWDSSGPQPAPNGSSPGPVYLGDVAEMDTWGRRAWVCFPVPCLAVLRTHVGEWCHSAFCCTCFNWRSSLAIHLGPHCLHNYHFCWLYTISSDKRICQNSSLLWTLRSSILVSVKVASVNIFVNAAFCFSWIISLGNGVSFDYLFWKTRRMLWWHFFCITILY